MRFGQSTAYVAIPEATKYRKGDKLHRNKKAMYSTIYFCLECRTAWQRERKGSNIVDYYPHWVKGDEYKKCPKCS